MLAERHKGLKKLSRVLIYLLHYTLCYILYCTILYYTILYYTILYSTLLYCTILYYPILSYTILYCTVLYCTVLYCTYTASLWYIPAKHGAPAGKIPACLQGTPPAAYISLPPLPTSALLSPDLQSVQQVCLVHHCISVASLIMCI